ncbi:MAG: hypothetical protein ACI9DC_005117 [Gammaproteobacteria bacterium]
MNQREKLERVCRYVARGPIALERLSVDGDGLVVYPLKHAFRDGTTHVLLEPLDFIARLAALVPCRRAHLVRYTTACLPRTPNTAATVSPAADPHESKEVKPHAAMSWMQRLRRVFAIDISTCPRCGGQVRVIAESALTVRILEHRVSPGSMKTKSSCEKAAGARAPPGALLH